MRLTSLQISGFGGVADRLNLDISADVTIFSGANGLGKTTIFDAIAWALTGVHPRGADPRNLYSYSGETRVELGLTDNQDGSWSVVRSLGDVTEKSTDQDTSLTIINETSGRLRGGRAQEWLQARLIARATDEEAADPSRTALYSYYLQQESLREFLGSRTDGERFSVLSTLVGAGRLTALVRDLESAKNAWIRAANKARPAIDSARQRHNSLGQARDRLAQQFAAAADRTQDVTEKRWWAGTNQLLTTGDESLLGRLTPDQFEQRMAALRSRADEVRQRVARLDFVLGELADPLSGPTDEELTRTRHEVEKSNSTVESATRAVTQAAEILTAVQAEFQSARTAAVELGAMAELALRHISDACPACAQDVNAEELRDRLLTLIADAGQSTQSPALLAALNAHAAAQSRYVEAVRRRTDVQAELRRLEESQEMATIRAGRLAQQIADLGIEVDTSDADRVQHPGLLHDQRSRVDQASRLASDELFKLQDSLAAGESLSTILWMGDENHRLDEATRAASASFEELHRLEEEQSERDRTSERADNLLRVLKADAEKYVNYRLEEIQPLLSQIYCAIDPHPAFKDVSLTTRNYYGKNRLDPVVHDRAYGVDSPDPGRVMSTSQANALAVALFLAFNLGLNPTRLEVIALDDPLQNLDDLHLLGLVDLLRRVAPHRQILISTHDPAFTRLLARKLRPVDGGSQVRVATIEAWTRRGPAVSMENVIEDRIPFKLASVQQSN